MAHTWWTIYNRAIERGEYPVCAMWLADEWAKRKGRENENPVIPQGDK